MSILLLNGSPHRDGQTLNLARMVTEDLPGKVERLDLYDLAILPCRGCGRCRDGGLCPQDAVDGMGCVIGGLERSDIVIVASPLHFTSLTGPVVTAFGRLQRYWKREPGLGGKPRRGGVVLTAGAEYADMFSPALRVAAAAYRTLGIAFAGSAAAAETDRVPATANAAAVAAARELALRLAPAERLV